MVRSLICEEFDKLSRELGSRVAIYALSERRVLTFEDVAEEQRLIAAAFERAGIGAGAAVVASVANRAEFVPVFLAALSVGAVLVPLDGHATAAELSTLADASGAIAVIALPGDLPPAVPQSGSSPGMCDLPGGLCLWTFAPRASTRDYGSAALLKLTSGSTDFPKAALTEESHLWHDGRHVIEAMGIGRSDVNLACIPLAHSYGLGNLVMPLVLQGTPLALRDSFSPGRLADDIAETHASVFPGVPFMFDHLCTSPLVEALPASLRLAISAGSRLDAATVRAFHGKFGRKIHSFYGCSETGGISYDDAADLNDPVTAGRPMPDTDVSLRPHAQAGPGAGRIHVSGTAITAGYASQVGDTNTSSFTDDGFLTGDLGYFDHAGQLLLTGRISVFVNVAGRKVDPHEVERVLLAIPGIADVRVFGVACDKRGQKLVACLVAREPGVTRAFVRKRCADSLSPHKIPRDFLFLEALPLTGRGKIDRQELEALVARATS